MFRPPPADLHTRQPLMHTAKAGSLWFRAYPGARDPVFFGKAAAYRWDDPKKHFGVLYLAADAHCAFMESIGRGCLKTRFVPASTLEAKHLATVRVRRDLHLIDLVSSGGLTRIGADASLPAGTGYRNSQRWSAQLRLHPTKPDGIYYRSRFDPARTACALYEHSADALDTATPLGPWSSQLALLGVILDHYQFGTDL